MSIFKNQYGWRAEVWIGKNRIATKSGFPTRNEALQWYDQQLADHKLNKSTKSEPITFDELLDRFESMHFPTVSESSRNRYHVDIRERIRPYFRFRTLDRIDSGSIEQFRTKIMKDLSPKSVNNCTDLLNAILKKAVEWDLLEKNPMKAKRLKLPEIKYTWWDKKEYISKFLEEAKSSRYYAAFRLSLECGLRLGEIVGLSKKDVDLERCQIHIHRQWLDKIYVYGPTKGRKERYISFDPKSDLKEALKEAIDRSRDPEIIFLTPRGKRVLGRKLGAHIFKSIIKRAGVPNIRFHDLRHTFASWYMIEVDDIWSLKGILGHVDVQTTQRYAHLSKKHQRIPMLNFSIN